MTNKMKTIKIGLLNKKMAAEQIRNYTHEHNACDQSVLKGRTLEQYIADQMKWIGWDHLENYEEYESDIKHCEYHKEIMQNLYWNRLPIEEKLSKEIENCDNCHCEHYAYVEVQEEDN